MQPLVADLICNPNQQILVSFRRWPQGSNIRVERLAHQAYLFDKNGKSYRIKKTNYGYKNDNFFTFTVS